MDRRNFVKSAIAVPAAAAFPWGSAIAASAPWRTYEITTTVQILKPNGISKAWIPLPMMEDNEWHRMSGNESSGNAARTQVYRDGKYGAGMLYAEWAPDQAKPVAVLTSRFSTRDRMVEFGKPVSGERLSPADVAFYTQPTDLMPTDGIVRQTALEATKGARGDIEKSRAIYEWIVDNTFRDPKTRGCGIGDIKSMLETRNLSGKCADLNALYVGMARSVGIPARDVYGLRVTPSQYGYRSLGANTDNVTRAQHCRAEFFAQGYGWVPVDPADVRKVVLEEPPGNLALGDPKVTRMRKQLFGSWEMNWLAYNNGHDIVLPNSGGKKVAFLMYPQAEVGGALLDPLDPDAFKYEIRAREVKA
jgi:transglutaminase-like putative cysteine protease